MADKYIGIFDSGIGGLTVVKSVLNVLPNQNIIYFGDSKNCPYGTKNNQEIHNLVINDIKFLKKFDLKAVVIACNTIDSCEGTFVKNNFDVPVYGVIKPASELAIKVSKNKIIGVLATLATVNSEVYVKTIKELDNSYTVIQNPATKLTDLIEQGKISLNDKETVEAVREYLDPLLKSNVDTIILGCTHYPILIDIFKQETQGINIVSSSDALANQLVNQITTSGENKRHYYVSDEVEFFKKKARIFMNDDNIENAKLIDD